MPSAASYWIIIHDIVLTARNSILCHYAVMTSPSSSHWVAYDLHRHEIKLIFPDVHTARKYQARNPEARILHGLEQTTTAWLPTPEGAESIRGSQGLGTILVVSFIDSTRAQAWNNRVFLGLPHPLSAKEICFKSMTGSDLKNQVDSIGS